MEKNLDDYILHQREFLDREFCKAVIQQLEQAEWETHVFASYENVTKGVIADKFEYSTTRVSPSGVNEPDVCFDCTANDIIIKNLHAIILDYIAGLKFDWFNGWAGYSPVKFIRYSLNQTMKNHCDHINTLFSGDRKGIPVLSIIGVFNDNYKGGKLIFFGDKEIDLKAGDLVIFPSNFLYPHQITPITEGIRYSYVSWTW